MSQAFESYAVWLADFYLLTAVLLGLAMTGCAVLKQPAQRLAVGKSALVGLLLLGVLSAIPGWSAIHLLTAQKPLAALPAVERAAPVVRTALPSAEVRAPMTTAEPANANSTKPMLPDEKASTPIQWELVLSALHVCGAVVVFGWLVLGWFASRALRRSARPAPPWVRALLGELSSSRGHLARAEVCTSERIDVAVALGVWRPVILVPERWCSEPALATESPERPNSSLQGRGNLRPVMAHELAHVANRDLHWVAFARVLLVALWAHPLFWFMRRRLRLDQEALADAAAAEVAGRQAYAEQLVAWAREASRRPAIQLSSAVGLWEGPSQLRQRISLLLNERLTILRRCSRRWRIGVAIVAASTALALSTLTLQPHTQANQKGPPIKDAADVAKTVAKEKLPRLAANTVAGRLVDHDDKPIVGAEILLFRVNQHDGSRAQVGNTSTDANGDFRFENVIDIDKEFPGRKFPPSYEVGDEMLEGAARAPGRVTATWLEMPSVVAEHGSFQRVKMLLAAIVRGRVTNRAGEPIAGALISIGYGSITAWKSAQAGRTDANGYYKIDDAQPFVEAQYKSQAAAQERLRKRDDARGIWSYSTIVMRPILTVEHADYAIKKCNLEKSPGSQDVVLDPAATLEGRVVYSDSGKPAPGARVGIVTSVVGRRPPLDATDIHKTYVRADGAGEYRAGSLPRGKYAVWAEVPGWVNVGANDVAAAAGKTTSVPDLVLSKGGVISARIVDAKTHEPVRVPPGARLMMLIEPESESSLRPVDAPFIAVNSKNRFELQLTPGKKKIRAGGVEIDGELKFSGPPSTEVSVNEGQKVEVDLAVSAIDGGPRQGGSADESRKSGGTQKEDDAAFSAPKERGNPAVQQWEANAISGRAVDKDGKPVEGAEVSLFRFNRISKERKLVARKSTDADGRFEFNRVIDIAKEFPDGKFWPLNLMDEEGLQVYVRKAGFATENRLELRQRVAKTGVFFDFKLAPAGTLRGRVTGPDGKPVTGALVSAGGAGFALWEGAVSARTNADGTYEITDASRFDMEVYRKKEAEDRERQRREMEALRANATEGMLADYIIPPPFLVVEHPEFATKYTNFEHIPGTRDVKLDPAAVIEGRVIYGDSKKPAAGVTVHGETSRPNNTLPAVGSISVAPLFVDARTDADGKYRFNMLPTGKYDLLAEKRDWVNEGIKSFDAPAETTSTAPDLVLTKGGVISIRLVDAKTNKPIPVTGDERAYVSAMPYPYPANLMVRPDWVPDAAPNVEKRFELRTRSGKRAVFVFQVIVGEEQKWAGRASAANPHAIVDVVEGTTVEVDVPVVDFKELPNHGITATIQAVPAGASAPTTEKKKKPAAPKKKDGANKKSVTIPIIVARHVLLLGGTEIITWDELETMIAALGNPSTAFPEFYITHGAMESGVSKSAYSRMDELHRKYKLTGHSLGTLSARTSMRYDAIRDKSDLTPDESLRVEGTVIDGKQKPVAGSEVVLITPVPESLAYESYDIALVKGRLRNRLDDVVTDTDAAGRFALYPPKRSKYYVLALHPDVGINIARGESLAHDSKVHLLSWAELTTELAPEPGAKQTASISTRFRGEDGYPEVSLAQYWSDLKDTKPTNVFGFTHVPPIMETSIQRDIAEPDGGSMGLNSASVSLLPGDSRRIDLGKMTDKEREYLKSLSEMLDEHRKPRGENAGAATETTAGKKK